MVLVYLEKNILPNNETPYQTTTKKFKPKPTKNQTKTKLTKNFSKIYRNINF